MSDWLSVLLNELACASLNLSSQQRELNSNVTVSSLPCSSQVVGQVTSGSRPAVSGMTHEHDSLVRELELWMRKYE